jgi:hypothetical protein
MAFFWNLRFIGSRPGYQEVREFLLRRMPRGAVCAEIGVKTGAFSEEILRIAKPSRLYLIDPWLPDPNRLVKPSPEKRYQMTRDRLARQINDGTAIIVRERSRDAVTHFADAFFDWIYIDGDHRYEAVKRDLEDYFPKVKPRGLMLCDDYHYAGHWDDGVTRAVDEFMRTGKCIKLFKRRSQFVMRKRSA